MGFGTANPDDYCWIFAAAYELRVARDADGPMFQTIREVYQGTNGQSGGFDDRGLPCASAALAAALGLRVGEVTGYALSPSGYPANMQPALAAAVDSGIPGAAEAWARFLARSIKPDPVSRSLIAMPWPDAPDSVTLPDGAVHVWRASLRVPPARWLPWKRRSTRTSGPGRRVPFPGAPGLLGGRPGRAARHPEPIGRDGEGQGRLRCDLEEGGIYVGIPPAATMRVSVARADRFR